MADKQYTDPDSYDLGHIVGSNAGDGFMIGQSVTPGAGYKTPNGDIASINGWPATESIFGPPGATTYISSGGANNFDAYDNFDRVTEPAKPIPGSTEFHTETLIGMGDHNTAILRGKPEDYHITMPGSLDEYQDKHFFEEKG